MYCHILRVHAIPTLESTDSMIKVRNIHKELLQVLYHHQCWAGTQAWPLCQGFQKVRQLRETLCLLPSVWVLAQRDPRPVECPCSRLYQLSELSTLFFSQLRHSHCVSLLRSRIMLANYACTISRLHKFLDCAESV